MTLALSLGPYVSRVSHTVARYPEGRVGVPQRKEVDSGALTHSLAFSILQSIAAYVCWVKWLYGLYYIVLTKLTLTEWTSGLKRFLQRNCRLKIMLIMRAQANYNKMVELTLLLLVGVLFASHITR